ncbi:MAG: MCE family protein [Thermoleophilaceae bacterium]|nr:MCE family protein [Thermoleophilaceae bacterium]
MRRLIWLGLAVAILPWLVIGVVDATGEQDREDAYFVRAIFDNAASLVEGEDVKIAGAVVGLVDSLDVTEDNKAAVVLRIDNEDFTPWRADAQCVIRPQSLIGEKFVECEPGSSSEARLDMIEEGEGEGELLLPVSGTSSPVDLDLLNNTLRLPYRQRLAILLSEFGTGLAGRGEQLNAVIHRANPALKETDEALKILADQNQVLVRLARDSDQALGPLARERERVAGFIVEANETGEASAERRQDISRGIERLPAFLRELRPLMADLDTLAVQGTPLLRDLGDAAPQMGRLIRTLGTFSEAGRESLPSLGDALERGRPALIRSRPLIQDLARLGRQARPAVDNLDKLTASLRDTQGVERINDFLYYLALGTNGFDSVGHYLRASLYASASCSNYVVEPNQNNCWATFFNPNEDSESASASTRANLAPEPAAGASGGSEAPTGGLLQDLLGTPSTPEQDRQREEGLERLRKRSEGASSALRSAEPMLDYLLGGER